MPLFQKREAVKTIEAIQLRWDNVNEFIVFIDSNKSLESNYKIKAYEVLSEKVAVLISTYERPSLRVDRSYECKESEWAFFDAGILHIETDDGFREFYQPKKP